MVILARSVAARAAPGPSMGEGFGSADYKVEGDKMNGSSIKKGYPAVL